MCSCFPYLFCRLTDHTGSEVRPCMCACTHMYICASPIEPALHSAQEANFQEEITGGSLTCFI